MSDYDELKQENESLKTQLKLYEKLPSSNDSLPMDTTTLDEPPGRIRSVYYHRPEFWFEPVRWINIRLTLYENGECNLKYYVMNESGIRVLHTRVESVAVGSATGADLFIFGPPKEQDILLPPHTDYNQDVSFFSEEVRIHFNYFASNSYLIKNRYWKYIEPGTFGETK